MEFRANEFTLLESPMSVRMDVCLRHAEERLSRRGNQCPVVSVFHLQSVQVDLGFLLPGKFLCCYSNLFL